MARTLNGFAIPSRGSTTNNFSNGPIPISNLDGSHSSFSSMPSGFENISATTCDWMFSAGSHNDGLRADRSKPIDVGTKLQLYNVVLGKDLSCLRI